MGYYINPAEMSSMFAVPASVVEKHLRLASAEQLKVLLWFLKNPACGSDISAAADALRLDTATFNDALLYWYDRGVLSKTDEPVKETGGADNECAVKKAVLSAAVKPNREESARRGLECPEIAFILRETERKFGRTLRQNEISTLVWLYDDQGIGSSLLMMIVEYAVSEGRPSMSFIERTAVEWVNDGVSDVLSAEKRLAEMRRRRSAWHTVETAMGIEHRMPSSAELEAADKWINEWGYGSEILRAAYEACVDATSKFSIPYIKKILSSWHKAGVKTVADIAVKTSPADNKSGDKYTDFINGLIMKNEED